MLRRSHPTGGPPCLKPSPIEPVPEVTARAARATFRKGNSLLSPRNELGAVFADADFANGIRALMRVKVGGAKARAVRRVLSGA